MQNTRLTLLQRAGSGTAEAWSELDGLYRPFVKNWFRSQGVAASDADDLTQDVLSALFKELPQFSHPGKTGSFRGWLRTFCLNRLLGFRRAQAIQARTIESTDLQSQTETIAEEDPLIADWEREHDQALLRHLFSQVESQFELETLAVFRSVALEGRDAPEVAKEFGITAGAVYVARSRVLRQLREAAKQLLGEELPDPPKSNQKS